MIHTVVISDLIHDILVDEGELVHVETETCGNVSKSIVTAINGWQYQIHIRPLCK